MFGGGGYGAGGGPGGFMSGGGFSGAEQSKMMFADMDDDEEEFEEDDYDGEDYDDEEEISATDSELLQMEQYRRQQAAAAAKAQSMAYQGPGSKPMGSSLYSGAGAMPPGNSMTMGALGGMGSMGGAGGFSSGGTQFGASDMSASGLGGSGLGGGGGFSYGMASAGGNVFGAPASNQNSGLGGGTSFGQNSSAIGGMGSQGSVGFTFGGASSFGGIGGGSGAFQSGATPGGLGAPAAAGDDPYANIAIDFSKVKAAPVAAKPFEAKTEEEKQKDAESRSTTIKSNLKTTKTDFEKAAENKKGVRFGKSTTYQVDVDSDDSGFYNRVDMQKEGGKGSPRLNKKIVAETDLSDGRDEQEKIRQQLEAEKEEQLNELKMMEEWKKKQEEKDKSGSAGNSLIDKMRIDQARLRAEMEESGNSSSLSVPKVKQIEESYTSDDFEDVSMSGSGSKKFDFQSGKMKVGLLNKNVKVEDSLRSSTDGYSVSNSKSIGDLKSNSRIGESSDVYDDDEFESVSKSHTQMNKVLPTVKRLETLKSITSDSGPTQIRGTSPDKLISIAQTYTRKENKQTMTDQGKYSYLSSEDAAPNNLKEFTLKKNLEEAEHLIQELKALRAEDRETVRELEKKLTKKDGDYQATRRDALGSGETVKSLKAQMADVRHKNDLYKIETERLIKEIDMADAKTREKENDLVLAQAEYDRKLKLVEERILYRRGKNEDRAMLDLKQEQALALDQLKQSNEEKQEEIDYQNTKINKLTVQVEQLTLAKDQKNEVKKLQAQLAMYEAKIEEHENKTSVKTDFSSCTGNLSAKQQVELQKDVTQLSRIIEGLNEENQRAESKIRDLTFQLKNSEKKVQAEKKLTKDLQLKQYLDQDKVFVEGEGADEVSISTANLMGPEHSISKKQLQELQERVKVLIYEKDDLVRNQLTKETTLAALNDKVRAEKAAVEKQLYQTEILVKEKDLDIRRIKDQNMEERNLNEGQIKDLEDKVAWFRDNQKILGEQQAQIAAQNRELNNLKGLKKQAEEDRAKSRDLEKKCQLLQETIKARNPNSIPMLIQATSEAQKAEEDDRGKKQLKYRIQALEAELEDRDKDFERRIRSLRQEQERMRQVYESRSANPHEAKKVNELEEELQKAKAYHHKRVRELEEKYRFGGALTQQTKQTTAPSPNKVSGISEDEANQLKQQVYEFSQQVEQLTRERNHFAQKLVARQSGMDQGQAPTPAKSLISEDIPEVQANIMLSQNDATETPATNNARLNPFFIEERQAQAQPSPQMTPPRQGGGSRSIPQCMQILQRINLRQFVGRHMKTPQLYQAFQGALTVEEIKAIKEFLSTKRQGQTIDPDDVAEVDGDFIDMDDLIEAVQLKHDLDERQPNQQQSFGMVQGTSASAAELDSLQRKIGRILREKDDDAEFFSSKIRQLKRNLKEANLEKSELEEQVQRLEQAKKRLEKFYKDKMGLTIDGNQTLSETLQKTKTGELIGEVGIIARRIEYLEEQADARSKTAQGDHTPCKREISRLNEELAQERSSRSILIGKKNAEIAYFKAELDGLLSEIASTSVGSSATKSCSPNLSD